MKPGSDDPARGAQAFLEWARGAAVPISIPRHDADYDDLSFIGDVIGNARVVAFGENAHYLHEWNRFRARLFKYLVRDHGFSVFILESGLVEGRHIHDYVDGKDVPWERVVGSVTNGWGVWAELQELIVWMREYNADPASPRRLRFYSTDGSGNWAHARIAFDAVLAFLARVDGKTAERIEREFGDEMRRAKFAGRDRLDRAAWDRLIAGSARIVSLIEQQCIAWGDSDSREEYDWGLESARVLRHLVLNFAQTETDFSIGFRTFWNVRDYAMAEQVQWILDREGPGARAVIGAHNTHLQQYPVRVQRATSMGAYLAERIGRDNVLFIGAQSAYSVKGEEPLPESNQAVYGRVGPDCYLLDLRRAPREGRLADWLRTERPDRSNLRYQPVAPGKAWDCFVFHRRVSIAEPQVPDSMRPGLGAPDPTRYDDYVGRYVLLGFLSQPTTLDITREGDRLFADGRDDTSGELFPPYRTEILPSDDGRFLWPNWPAVLEFRGAPKAGGVSIIMPGMGTYEGARETL